MSHFHTPFAALTLFIALLIAVGCEHSPNQDQSSDQAEAEEATTVDDPDPASDQDGDDGATDDVRADEREQMVVRQIERRGISDERVLKAMRAVPRHAYVPENVRPQAYRDSPLPIGLEQTISQPYIVALMSELLQVSPGQKVLEIGTGSGYQAAVLAEMGADVYSIEILCELAERADEDLSATGYDEVNVRCGDGYKGWPEQAPFERIIVTAAPPELPQDLVDQLAVGGRLVVPVGEQRQMLQVVTKTDDDTIETSDQLPVRFVPMVPGEE